jgi:hypothetical protein
MLLFKNLLEAKGGGDELSARALSFRLAHQRLKSTGLRYVAIVAVPQEFDDRHRLDGVLQSMNLGRVALNIIWQNPVHDELITKDVYLVLMFDTKQFVAINRHAAAIAFENLDGDFDLAESIRNLNPGWHLAEVNLPASSFVEALASMNAGIESGA